MSIYTIGLACIYGTFAVVTVWTFREVWRDHRADKRRREDEQADARLRALYDARRIEAAIFAEQRIDALADPAHPYWSNFEKEVTR